jgi:hypothetical protein
VQEDLEGVTSICFTIDHIAYFVENAFPGVIPGCPIVSGSTTVFGEIDVFRII